MSRRLHDQHPHARTNLLARGAPHRARRRQLRPRRSGRRPGQRTDRARAPRQGRRAPRNTEFAGGGRRQAGWLGVGGDADGEADFRPGEGATFEGVNDAESCGEARWWCG